MEFAPYYDFIDCNDCNDCNDYNSLAGMKLVCPKP
jgi:hypothetical protein